MSILASFLGSGQTTTTTRAPLRHAASCESGLASLACTESTADLQGAELAEQLVKERQRADEKEEEVLRMRMQMAKLEDMLEQQANINKMDAEHLTKLEAALAEVQDKTPGTEVQKLEVALHAEQEEKAMKEAELEGMNTLVAKLEETIDQQAKVAELNKEQQAVIVDLVASLNEEKQKVEELSKSEESAVTQLQQQLQSLQEKLDAATAERNDAPSNDGLSQAKLAEMQKRMEQLQAEVSSKDQQISRLETDASALTLVTEYARQVSNMSGVSESSEVQIAVLSQQLEDMDTKYKSLARDMKLREAHAAGLQAQLACEESKRRAAEQVICAAENEIRHLKDAAKASHREKSKSTPNSRGNSPSRKAPNAAAKQREVQEQLKKEMAFRKQAQETITEKENEVQEMKQKLLEEEEERLVVKEQAVKMQQEVTDLQKRLAEELSQRQAVQTKLIARERKSLEAEKHHAEKASVKAAMSKVLEKDVQICELQQELQQELTKRQMVQSKAMEVEEQLCLAQQQLALELSRRVEAESKAVERDGQLKTIRTHFAQELLHSMQKSTQIVACNTQNDDGLGESFRSESSCTDDGGSSISSSWRGIAGMTWSRPTAIPPDTGSSFDNEDHMARPLGASQYDHTEQKPRASFGFSNGPSPQRSPMLSTRQLEDEDQLTKRAGFNLRAVFKNRIYTEIAPAPMSAQLIPAPPAGPPPAVNIYTPTAGSTAATAPVAPGTRSSLPCGVTAGSSFMPTVAGGSSVNVRPAQHGSITSAPLTSSISNTRTASKEVYSYATSSPNMASVARVIRAASKQ